MIPAMTKNTTFLRILLLAGETLASTLVLLIGTGVSPVFGFSLHSSAHAAAHVVTTGNVTTVVRVPTLCAAEPTGPHCENEDPVVQGCDRDAQTLAYKELYDRQWKLLAIVERRYSPTCQSEWGRITQAPGVRQPVGVAIARHPMRSTSGPIAFSTMVFVPNLSRASQIIGSISISGLPPEQGGAGFDAILPALPPDQQ